MRQEIRDSAGHLSEQIPPRNLRAVWRVTICNMGKARAAGEAVSGLGDRQEHKKRFTDLTDHLQMITAVHGL